MSRYLVGIDLGTTHTVVAYADSEAPAGPPEVFPIPQLVAPGEVAERPLLPSLRYHPARGEIAPSDRVLPWETDPSEDPVPDAINGRPGPGPGLPGPRPSGQQRQELALAPGGGPHRPHPALGGPAGGPARLPPGRQRQLSASRPPRLGPALPGPPTRAQDLVLTVPASFDEVARRLTVEAARIAGLPRVRLVEEPQAACYDWLARHGDTLEQALAGVRTLLVCDVGGGTTDLTLIRVDRAEGEPRLVRIGVGDHLMLGGDNMDLALAHLAEGRLTRGGQPLGAAQLTQLVAQCRGAKERLLARGAPETASVTLLGAGARLIGQAQTTELGPRGGRGPGGRWILPGDGLDERPQRRRAGLVELGLPYAADPAVTRHLAAFLADHAQALREAGGEETGAGDGPPVPDAVLLNGGVFHSEALASRILQVLGRWRGQAPLRLHNDEPDLAVARGAVAYALARRGQGRRIGGGFARNLLLLVDEEGGRARRAVCLLPRGSEEGQELRLTERVFSLRLGQPVHFHLLVTASDRSLAPGELVDLDSTQCRALPPLATVLGSATENGAREVQVQLAARLTDVGTLEIDCVETGQAYPDAPGHLDGDTQGNRRGRWRLELQLRGQEAQARGARTSPDSPRPFARPAERIERVYGARIAGIGPKETKQLQGDLERLLGRRGTWDTGLLRALYGILWDGVGRRRRSADHERLWLNLAGFCLRPGFGHPLDDWRVRRLWSVYEQWRPVSGGVAQLGRVVDPVAAGLRRAGPDPAAAHPQRCGGETRRSRPARRQGGEGHPLGRPDPPGGGPGAAAGGAKVRLGERLLGAGRRPTDSPQRWWALGRLGARVPFYGSAHDLVPRERAEAWLEQVLSLDWRTLDPAAFAATQLARLSGDRERDLSPDIRERVVERLQREKAPQKWIAMVQTVTELDSADQSLIFGESLPPGLRLVE